MSTEKKQKPKKAKGPTDANDLHLEKGLQEVKRQIEAALQNPVALADVPPWDSPAPSFEGIDGYEDYPELVVDAGLPVQPPAPSDLGAPTLEKLLQRYALAMPDAKVWDAQQRKLLPQRAFKAFVGGDALYKQWLEHEARRTVNVDDVRPLEAAAQAQGGGGLADAIERYVYLNPSDSAWNRDTREVVALSHLRYAIADCFDQWIKHPQRREIPLANLVFDPTQGVDTKTHINRFRGLPLSPGGDADKSRCMRAMLYQLCNENDEAYVWLVRWLAYPLQHVGAKMDTAVLMHSDVHGSGKSFFFDGVMRAIYGEYCRTFGQTQLESQYNDWISETLFGVFEEVLSRSQRYSHTGTLKQMITGKTFRVEKKYVAGWEEANHMNCVFLSNEVQPLPVEPSDRRFLVIWPEVKLIDELQKGVDTELKNGGAASFYQWLLETDLRDFTPHTKPPMTDAKKRLIDFGRPSWEVFYEEWRNEELDKLPYCPCLVKQLFKVFERWCSERKEHCMGQNRFSGFIASKERRVRDVHWKVGSQAGKGVFFMAGPGRCPADKTQEEWLGGCVQSFDEWLYKNVEAE